MIRGASAWSGRSALGILGLCQSCRASYQVSSISWQVFTSCPRGVRALFIAKIIYTSSQAWQSCCHLRSYPHQRRF
ncbi:hypothetical protein EV421DRAFT_1854112 [Armillaria borealis]|uniref:Secreted protein n=1 Tax=Armillaria borealis TaxID=47425 RepID=A0AA39IX37_9AGAR|nr:hypothetical protein EV421DRAFT_1854112 [Armillaria borealis]